MVDELREAVSAVNVFQMLPTDHHREAVQDLFHRLMRFWSFVRLALG